MSGTAMTLAVVVPLLGSLLVALTGAKPNLRETMSIGTGVVLFAIVAAMAGDVFGGARPEVVIAEPLPGLAIVLAAEPLGMLFALIASFLWIVTTVYAIGYMRGHHEVNQTRFYLFFAIAIGSTMGVALSGNLFTLFLFYEVLTLSTYPLVTHAGTDEARAGGRVYLGILIATSMGLFLVAIIVTAVTAGNVAFTPGGVFDESTHGLLLGVLLVLYTFGIGKAALMPFHRWLPSAMVAPTPVSALLHAVAVVKAGVFSVLKIIVYIFGAERLTSMVTADVLAHIAGFTILAASLVAMRKDNLKARLAYSTVSQLSYVVLGALLAVQSGIIGSAMHIAMHAFGKITLFFCAGAILVAAHKTRVSELDGLGRAMPWTLGAFAVAALSIAGLPPGGGLWSKWFLVLGTVDTGHYLLLGVLLVSTLLNIWYLLEIPVRGFFRPAPADDHAHHGEAPPACLGAIGVTAAMSVILFLYPEPLYRAAALLVG